ncbi:MAG: copper homeostasis protein CutC [Planctomycetota bacterium]|nr:MAG: copper homeostasis protein CutC [Planctomycetota bacterium]
MSSALSPYLLEVCVDSLACARAAERAGADRLELNAGLELGGLTPSAGLVECALRECSCEVVAMLRPRGAGFCYSPDELQVMRRDAERLCDQGVRAIALGVLTRQRQIDAAACRFLTDRLDSVQFVFHRAFDCVLDPMAALEQLVELGFDRVLTSGLAPTALQGADLLGALHTRSRGRITVMPASGVTPETLPLLVERTGCREFHGSFSTTQNDYAGPVSAGHFRRVDAARVASARRALDSCASQ